MHANMIEDAPSTSELFASAIVLANVDSGDSAFLVMSLLHFSIEAFKKLHIDFTLGKIRKSFIRP